ncbi:hypothetical protein IT570_01320 [Candidatus Sumerlaeota bacterium]|nr:hypothetical protein [Candidatus Sumerlaeota bacterium]
MMGAFGIDEQFTEFIVYGIVFFVLVVLLVFLSIFMKKVMASRARNITTPFGLSPREMENLKQSGGMTEDEIKRVRAAMAKQIVDRYREEENKMKMTGGADLALAAFEARVVAEGVEKLKKEEMGSGQPGPPPVAAPAPATRQVPVPQEQPMSPSIPSHLEHLLGRSEMELESLLAAGFLTVDDFALLRKAAQRS